MVTAGQRVRKKIEVFNWTRVVVFFRVGGSGGARTAAGRRGDGAGCGSGVRVTGGPVR